MLHGHDDVLGGSDQVHRPAHSLHHLTRDLPVGDVALFAYFHGAQDGEIDLSGADHAETHGGIEERGAFQRRNGLLAGIDQIRIFFAFERKRSDTEQSIFRLQHYFHAGGNVIGNQGRDPDAEVDGPSRPFTSRAMRLAIPFLSNMARDD